MPPIGFSFDSPLVAADIFDVTTDSIEVWMWQMRFRIPSTQTTGHLGADPDA